VFLLVDCGGRAAAYFSSSVFASYLPFLLLEAVRTVTAVLSASSFTARFFS